MILMQPFSSGSFGGCLMRKMKAQGKFFFFPSFLSFIRGNWPLGISDFDPMAVTGPILV